MKVSKLRLYLGRALLFSLVLAGAYQPGSVYSDVPTPVDPPPPGLCTGIPLPGQNGTPIAIPGTQPTQYQCCVGETCQNHPPPSGNCNPNRDTWNVVLVTQESYDTCGRDCDGNSSRYLSSRNVDKTVYRCVALGVGVGVWTQVCSSQKLETWDCEETSSSCPRNRDGSGGGTYLEGLVSPGPGVDDHKCDGIPPPILV